MFDPPTEDEEYDDEDEWDPPMEPAQIQDQFPEEYDPAPDDDE